MLDSPSGVRVPVLDLLFTSDFAPDMDGLRKHCYPGDYPTGSSRDQFDAACIHVVARADGTLAGAGRLIPSPTEYFRIKSDGQVVVPDEKGVAYFGRLMVAREHRGHDLFALLMVSGLLHARDAGFSLVFGGMRPDRKFRPFLWGLGFREYGKPYLAHFPPGDEMDQTLILDTRIDQGWDHQRVEILSRLEAKGYHFRQPSPVRATPIGAC